MVDILKMWFLTIANPAHQWQSEALVPPYLMRLEMQTSISEKVHESMILNFSAVPHGIAVWGII